MSANEERKLIKQIKELEATRANIMANAWLEAKQNEEKEERKSNAI
jgi:hypothetical protein